LLRLLERCDALRKPARFREALLACECDARGRLGKTEEEYPQRQRLLGALEAALGVVTEAIASEAMAAGRQGPEIGALIQAARVRALQQYLAPGH
jgi:tRNA nucleotidyltransferase (CCA-adding enzyme)